eukprot:9875715-Ditylum_brightwellii.AAC.1
MKIGWYVDENSAAYKIDWDLVTGGVEHETLIGPHAWQLLSKQEIILKDLKSSLLEVRELSIAQG